LIKSGLAGDVFWHWFEQDEPLMDGFTQATGKTFSTIHLAADKTLYFPEVDPRFACDVCYVGSYLPLKRPFFRKHVLPLAGRYDLRVFGSDWTLGNRLLGKVQKVGQYFNIDPLKKVRALGLSLGDERKLYSSARISLNVHEEQVKISNCEVNERTFKILACGGFQLSDNVPLLRRFFSAQELAIAENTDDWFDKVRFYLDNPEKRAAIAQAGRKKVLQEHTYHNRVRQIVELGAK
jgi:spore maturation protein CgeB